MSQLTRRQLLGRLAGGLALGALSCRGIGCGASERTPPVSEVETGPPAPPATPDLPPVFHAVDAEGSYRQLGEVLGAGARGQIEYVAGHDGAYARVQEAARGPERDRLGRYLEATRSRFPHLIEELEGMAEGAGASFDELFAWNCRSELLAAMDPCPPGCSTIGVSGEGRMVLAHNEDGGEVYLGRMVLVRARPPSGLGYACLVYPGTLPGNGPGLNARGIGQTTNYIAPCQPAEAGIPRYFLGRAVLEAESLDRAVALATLENRAFPWHHNLASLSEARLISLETWPGRHHLREVRGVHLHTNHLTHPEMQDLPERDEYFDRSTGPRMEALERYVAEHPLDTAQHLLEALRDRSGSPCRVCRRPGDEVGGVTVAAALYESPRVELTLIQGPPCGDGATLTVAPPAA